MYDGDSVYAVAWDIEYNGIDDIFEYIDKLYFVDAGEEVPVFLQIERGDYDEPTRNLSSEDEPQVPQVELRECSQDEENYI